MIELVTVMGVIKAGLGLAVAAWGAYNAVKAGRWKAAQGNTEEALDFLITGLELAPQGNSVKKAKDAMTYFREAYTKQSPEIEAKIKEVTALVAHLKGMGEDPVKTREAAMIVQAARKARK